MATQTLTTQNLFASKAAAPANPVPQQKIRAYKDFLTPALHRRFTLAAGIVICYCLIEAFFLSSISHFLWSWFPLGSAGLRALLVFIPCLAVFIVRIANIHIGERTSTSGIESVYSQLAGAKGIVSTLHTFAWYVFSAWFFGEIYIWTRSERAELAMVDPGRAYERPRLNENPIYLRCLFVWAGLVQAGVHLIWDYDRVVIPLAKEDEQHEDNVITRTVGRFLERIPNPARVVIERTGKIGLASFNLTLVVNMVHLVTYFLFVRRLVWPWTYSTARMLFSHLPENAPPTGIMHIGTIIWQILAAPLSLTFLWNVSNTVFGSSMTQAPLKKTYPLTNEIKDNRGVVLHKSKDPNGSLLTGLKSKNKMMKSFAFWELYIICSQFDDRRKTIYTEVDRQGGSTWSQVCEVALQEVEAIKQRINAANQAVDYKAQQAANDAQQQYHKDLIAYNPEEATGLRRIADQGVKDGADVYTKPKSDYKKAFGNMARSIGQSPGGQDPISPRARKAIQWGADHYLTAEQKQAITPAHLQQELKGYQTRFLQTQLGEIFRQTFARKARNIIFGSPTSNRANVIHAIKSLTMLSVSSLKEDDYGQVQKDIARIVKTFTSSIQAIENFINTLQPHFTDVMFKKTDRKVIEIEQLLAVLKGGLAEIMLAFGEYTSTLGLSKKEVREANEASAVREEKKLPALPDFRRPEMVEMPPAPAPVDSRPRQRRVYN